MRRVASVADVRAAEAAAGVPESVLVDRASTAVARRAAQLLGRVYGARVLAVAGPGHNGADALWAAEKLRLRGAAVDVALPLGEPRDEHGAEPLRRLRASGARVVTEGGSYDLCLDGVLGVGARRWEGDAPPPWQGLLRSPVLAVDVPTGVDADTGAAGPGAVRAVATVTFGAVKPGLVLGAGAEHAGLVEVAPIGLPLGTTQWSGYVASEGVWTLEARDCAVAEPDASTDKYRRGVVGVAAGSAAYPGAAALTCRGAQRAGCGYVRLRSTVADQVRAAFPEVVAGEGRVDAWVVGPGLGTGAAALEVLRSVLADDVPVVVDADGLTLLAENRDLLVRSAPTVLTPHTGEFERLTKVPRHRAEADRLGSARRAAEDLGAIVLLKGTTTVVAGPDGAAYVNTTGTPWLGTAGTGDVLAGAIGALLSRDQPRDGQLARWYAALAAARAAWLHGMAGRLAARGAAATALDVAERLPDAARIAWG